MAQHPTTKSVPSLVAGVTLSAGFGFAGYLLQKGETTDGHGVALLVSSITMGAMGLRAMRTKKTLPASIASLGAVSTAYHAHCFTNWLGQE
ncbi:transmembrane proteins 14c protein [Plasmopara halstedii]|uniref:Transmembrane proteins 14c protein n=1 Tax=Plasmopara halstedii TaxID=4781 RepID=A0A0P1ANR1_PLAHL|nr:transmembrane proteins 14c protein [Plasmopara halstedii]CEG43144.1 transmembrane proteins 14c protein [Plasmopara halstedii]|eukprot:XP_024579513.1 transmembrane proteins 14c protein [Plasmopara halstedii]